MRKTDFRPGNHEIGNTDKFWRDGTKRMPDSDSATKNYMKTAGFVSGQFWLLTCVIWILTCHSILSIVYLERRRSTLLVWKPKKFSWILEITLWKIWKSIIKKDTCRYFIYIDPILIKFSIRFIEKTGLYFPFPHFKDNFKNIYAF